MEFGVHEYTLEQRIKEVELCVNQQMWQAALALALTIPDICGQIKFVTLKMQNRKGMLVDASQGYKYSRWFHEYVEHHFADEKGWDGDGYAVNPYFTGDMCYHLRCAFLHSGEDATNEANNRIKYKFSLRTNSCDTISLNRDSEIIYVDIDIANLCNYICEGALKFIHEWKKPQDFTDRKCRWLDLKEWAGCMKGLNGQGEYMENMKDKIDSLLEKPYLVIDFLPEQVKPEGNGQYTEVEQYYQKHTAKKRLYQKFVDILLKLNCYYDFQVNFHDEDHLSKNPAPEILARWVLQCGSNDGDYINILIEEENAMLVVDGSDLCISVYNPSDRLSAMVQTLATAEGLFLWQP